MHTELKEETKFLICRWHFICSHLKDSTDRHTPHLYTNLGHRIQHKHTKKNLSNLYILTCGHKDQKDNTIYSCSKKIKYLGINLTGLVC